MKALSLVAFTESKNLKNMRLAIKPGGFYACKASFWVFNNCRWAFGWLPSILDSVFRHLRGGRPGFGLRFLSARFCLSLSNFWFLQKALILRMHSYEISLLHSRI